MRNQIIFLLLIFGLVNFSLEQDEVPLYQLNNIYTDDFVREYLESSSNEIKTEDCKKGSIEQITKIQVSPTVISKGKEFTLKVGGVLKEDVKIKGLHLKVWWNGQQIHEEDVDKKSDSKKGPYFYDYTTTVPTFTPSGHWETYIYLRDENDNDISCVKATFNV